MNNPLLSFGRGLPDYAAIQASHIKPAITELLAKAQKAVDASVDPSTPNTWADLVEPLENATEELGRSWGVIGHLNSVADTPELREAYGEMLPEVTAFWSSLGQNLNLYKKYKALSQSTEFQQLSLAQRKVIENSLRDFRLGGAELSDDQKPRFSAIQDEQALLSKAFSDHVLDATDNYVHQITNSHDLAGLPEDALAAAKQTAELKGLDGWAFTLHFPSYFPVMQFCDNRELRKNLYQAYITRASELGSEYGNGKAEWDNTQNMLLQLRLKDEEAKMLGFANYAALSLAPKMAKTVAEVDQFLLDFAKRAKSHGQKDWDDLQQFAKEHLNIEKLEPWDMAYASEKLKQARYSFSENELKQYFPLPKVLDGLFSIIQTLFGVKIEEDALPKWHADVKSFKVTSA
ncbi:MAG: M3 family metallopeptidase, partial [Polynucleobacter victoriensis]